MKTHPVGTGPFKFDSYQQDVSAKVTRNPDYWIKGKPYLEGIEFMFVVDPMTAQMTMQTGDAEIANIMGAKAAADYNAIGMKVVLVMDDNCYLAGDTADADSPWANQKVREAVEYAIDKEAIAKAFGSGYWKAP